MKRETSQKIIRSTILVFICILVMVSSLDFRFSWSHVPIPMVVLGDLLILVGFWIVFLTFRENTFASSVIEVEESQKVITTGVYGIIRHPMYAGALVMMIGTPLALGSWWGLLLVIPILGGFVARIFDEETFLSRHLSGYREYCQKVHDRLVPGLW